MSIIIQSPNGMGCRAVKEERERDGQRGRKRGEGKRGEETFRLFQPVNIAEINNLRWRALRFYRKEQRGARKGATAAEGEGERTNDKKVK